MEWNQTRCDSARTDNILGGNCLQQEPGPGNNFRFIKKSHIWQALSCYELCKLSVAERLTRTSAKLGESGSMPFPGPWHGVRFLMQTLLQRCCLFLLTPSNQQNPRTHAHAHTHTHARTHTYIRMHAHARTHICTYTRTHTHTSTHAARTCTHTHAHTHACTHTHIRTNAHMHAHAYTHTHTHTHTHTRTHTYIHMRKSSRYTYYIVSRQHGEDVVEDINTSLHLFAFRHHTRQLGNHHR